jgi:hypothetical protein
MTTPIAVGERVTWTSCTHKFETVTNVGTVRRIYTGIDREFWTADIDMDGMTTWAYVNELTRIEGEPSSRVVDGAGDEEVVG